jgi:hypothetical protein
LICALEPSIDDRADDVSPLVFADLRTLNGERSNKASLLLIYAPSRKRVLFD